MCARSPAPLPSDVQTNSMAAKKIIQFRGTTLGYAEEEYVWQARPRGREWRDEAAPASTLQPIGSTGCRAGRYSPSTSRHAELNGAFGKSLVGCREGVVRRQRRWSRSNGAGLQRHCRSARAAQRGTRCARHAFHPLPISRHNKIGRRIEHVRLAAGSAPAAEAQQGRQPRASQCATTTASSKPNARKCDRS